MVIFPITIVLSITIYIYYKVQIARMKDPLMKEHTTAKGKIALGVFLVSFAINQYLFYQTQLALFVVIVFIIFGIMQFIHGIKTTKFYGKQLKERTEA